MNILYLMYRFPYPLDRGDKLRAFNQIKFLSKKNNIFLCSVLDEPLSDDSKSIVAKYCKEIHTYNISKSAFYFNLFKNLLSGKPLQNAYVFDNSIKKKIAKIIVDKKIDRAMCLMIRPAEYLTDLNIPTTLDYQDVLSKGFERRSDSLTGLKQKVYLNEAHRLAKFEEEMFDKYTNKLIITEEDKFFIPHDNRDQIHVIGNGIDMEYFKPTQSDKNFELIFVGNMQYQPNVVSMIYLVENILPLIRKKLPKAKLLIAGADPVDEIKALQNDYIHVSGRLEDIRVAYRQGRVFVAPMLLGTGLQNKLLEAMAMKLPVVTSDLCNKGLKAIESKHLLIGRTPQEYADHCISLLEKDDFSNFITDNAYKFISENYSWDSINSELEKIVLGE